MKVPRILLTACSSGSGKTFITCGLLELLKELGHHPVAFKCGPDYIDPMFHEQVIETKSRNLDTFLSSPDCVRSLLAEHTGNGQIAVMEGVMGYYDGVGGITERASAYDLARVTETPVILLVNSKGMSVSLSAMIKGFAEYKTDSRIKGVIFNQMSPMLYPRIKKLTEQETGVRVLGYVPKLTDCVLESRHLGLVLPEEVPALKEKVQKLAEVLKETLDLDEILELSRQAPELEAPKEERFFQTGNPVRVGVARDEAFCFFYEDNLALLQKMGAEPVYFSPVHDEILPENLDGLLLYGGYPELYAEKLEENRSMRESIEAALRKGMPCMAECGGFMYLHEWMEDMSGEAHAMVSAIPGKAYRTGKLSRFGYLTLRANEKDEWGEIPAHEFHYFDSTNCGTDFYAQKPESSRSWNCMHRTGRILAGFPHLYYYGNPKVPEHFLKECLNYKEERSKET